MGDHRPSALISAAIGNERNSPTKPRSLPIAALVYPTTFSEIYLLDPASLC
jgi:hypothetical protein